MVLDDFKVVIEGAPLVALVLAGVLLASAGVAVGAAVRQVVLERRARVREDEQRLILEDW